VSVPQPKQIIYYLVSVDWRSVVEPPRKKPKTDEKLQIYLKLKNSLKNIDFTAILTTEEYESYERGKTIQSSTSNLHNIIKKIDKIDSCRSELYCILGLELANFKYLHVKNKCSNCVSEINIFKVSECTTCCSVKNKMQDCYREMRDIVNKSSDCINFYIWLSKLSTKFPKFKYVALSTNDVKKLGYAYLDIAMSTDKDLWI